LHHNLGEMLKRLVEQHLSELHRLFRDHWRDPVNTKSENANASHSHFYKGESGAEREQRDNHERYRQRHEMVHALARADRSVREIAKITGLARTTVQSILNTPTYTGVPQRGPCSSPIDRHRDFIAQNVAAGRINAVQLYKEIQTQGFTGVYSTVWRLVRCLARQSGQLATNGPVVNQPRPSAISLPSVFEVVQWLMDKQHTLTPEQTGFLKQWLGSMPAVQDGRDAAQRFTEILTERLPEKLEAWVAKAATSSSSVIRGFAKGIKADYDAVLAALQLPWSNAQLEGQVNRLKVIKRVMYGRAKFDLLKIRVMTKI
jgi:transposase